MSLIDQIKKDQIEARKLKKPSAAYLTTLLSEATMVGKNKRNGPPTDEEVLQVVRKFIKNLEESIHFCKNHGRDSTGQEEELEIYKVYVPEQLSDEDLTMIVRVHIGHNCLEGIKAMGQVMKWLSENYNGKYDGKTASNIVRTVLSA